MAMVVTLLRKIPVVKWPHGRPVRQPRVGRDETIGGSSAQLTVVMIY